MQNTTLFGLCGAALIGLGLYTVLVHPQLLRKLVGMNLFSSGTFLLFGVVARRGAHGVLGSDPVPQAMVITGIVVAFAGTALAVALALRLHELTGRASIRPPPGEDEPS